MRPAQSPLKRNWKIPLWLALITLIAVGYILRPKGGEPGASSMIERALMWPSRVVANVTGDGNEGVLKSAEEARLLQTRIAELETELSLAQAELADWRRGTGIGRGGSTLDLPKSYLFLAADVIARQPRPRRQSVAINRGSRQGVAAGMPVVTDLGVFGVVREVEEQTSFVQLISDPHFAIAVELESDPPSSGVAFGKSDADKMKLQLERAIVPPTEPTFIRTAGLDGSLFPPGLLLARLQGSTNSKRRISEFEALPVADLSARFVLILQSW